MYNKQVYMSVIVLLGIYLSCIQVGSIDIECVPLENCSSLINILAKGRNSENVLKFLNSSKCGIDENNPNKVKVWCNYFRNCKTFDSRNGTCAPMSTCAEFNDLLQSTITDQQKQKLFNKYRCHFPNKLNNDLVCCPWSYSVNNIEDIGKIRTKRDQFPWLMPQHKHFYKNNFEFLNNKFNNENELENHDNKTLFNNYNPENHLHANQHEHHGHVGHWWKPKWLNVEDAFIEEKKVENTCYTSDNMKGICREIHLCTNLIDVLKTVNRSDNKSVGYLKKLKCPSSSYSNMKVCCPEDKIVKPKINLQTETRVDKTNDSNLASDPCGHQIPSERIIGGTTAGLSEFPWTALLQYNTTKGILNGCGGSVINKRYIITAAHCVNKDVLRQNGLQTLDRIVLGEYDTRNETDCMYTKFGSNCANPPQYFNIDTIIQHELFNSNRTANDIALIRVDRDIQNSDYIKPICLPRKGPFYLRGNESFLITGWGKTETGQVSPVKRKARIPFVDKARCSRFGSLGVGQICLGSDKGVDSCKGDSGGPVMKITISGTDEVTTLVGIISYGFGNCGTTTSVSTYIPYYLEWISANVKI